MFTTTLSIGQLLHTFCFLFQFSNGSHKVTHRHLWARTVTKLSNCNSKMEEIFSTFGLCKKIIGFNLTEKIFLKIPTIKLKKNLLIENFPLFWFSNIIKNQFRSFKFIVFLFFVKRLNEPFVV